MNLAVCLKGRSGGVEFLSDDQAMAERLQRLRPALITLAEALIAPAVRSELDASDLVQQTLLEAHLDRQSLSIFSEQQVLSWLREALRHNVVDAARHLKTQKNDVRRNCRLGDLHTTVTRIADLLAADQTSPSEYVEREEQVAKLLEAMQSLTDGQRQAVILKHLRGCGGSSRPPVGWSRIPRADEVKTTCENVVSRERGVDDVETH